MPPKAKVNKKTEVKKKEKLIDDKTFGMKNKKGGKAQKVRDHFSPVDIPELYIYFCRHTKTKN